MKFLRTMFRCCSGFRAYQEIRDLSALSSLIYLFQLLVLLTTILAVVFLPKAWRFADQAADWMKDNVPSFRIHNGKVTTDFAQPFRAGNDDFLFLLDTTGKITAADPQSAHGILVTADSLVFWRKDPTASVQAQRHNLTGLPDTKITADYIRMTLRAAVCVSIPVIGAIALCIILAQITLFALAGSLLERNMPNGLRWTQLFNIALHAITPAAIIFTAYTAMQLEGLDLQLIYICVYGFFLLGASNACRTRAPEPERTDNEPL